MRNISNVLALNIQKWLSLNGILNQRKSTKVIFEYSLKVSESNLILQQTLPVMLLIGRAVFPARISTNWGFQVFID